MPSRRSRLRKLDTVVASLQVQYGQRAVQRNAAPRALPAPEVPHISTTFPALDAALGIGGLPQGRISEISGPPTSGKLTLAAKALSAAHQKPGVLAAWFDLSHTIDPDYLHRCGLDLDRLLIIRADTGSDALAILLQLVESNTLAALVFDSLSDLGPLSDSSLTATLQRLATLTPQTGTAVIFLSEPATQSRTLAHVAAVRLELRRERWIMQGADVRGYECRVHIAKHKLGRAGADVPIRIAFNGTVRGVGL